MHEEKTVERFIELRSQGWTYTWLIAELNVSQSTLIKLTNATTRSRTGRDKAAGFTVLTRALAVKK